ncbi:MAG: glucosaminidase domain-containing protein [Puniceicoccales bacterium]|jgi:hypothetical protein|nr:glucosaminidase domain-containing protein [Puniceicoccales bacterium]
MKRPLVLFIFVMVVVLAYVRWGLEDIPGEEIYGIMGKGKATEQMMFRYIRQHNTKISSTRLKYLIECYLWESAFEGVNGDAAFAQMCHETNFLKFDGNIDGKQNNFNSLGTMVYDMYWACFFTIKEGVRAHVQHLKAYGSKKPLKNPCVDPRFDVVKKGSVKSVRDLNSKWAGLEYGKSIEKKIDMLLSM